MLYHILPLNDAYVARHADELPSIDFYRITLATQLAVYNSVVLAWREKVTVIALLFPRNFHAALQ